MSERYEVYCDTRERVAYAAHAGLTISEADAELDDVFGDVTSGDGLEALREERERSRDEAQRARLLRLILGCEQAYIDARLRPLRSELSRAARERAPSEAQSALREELFRERGAAYERFGYESGLARARARLPDVSLERWIDAAQRYLDATDVIYREALRDVLPRFGVEPDTARAQDASAIDHLGAQFEALFPDSLAFQCLAPTLSGWNIDVERLKGMRIDSEPRVGREPSVAPFALRVPGEVVLSAGAQAGVGAYVATFHAAGRALGWAFTSAALPVVQRRVHDRALDRAWGWLLSDRFADSTWLETFPAGRHAAAMGRAFHFRQLFAQRRCAGRALFAWELARMPAGTDVRRLADLFAEGALRATGLAHAPPFYLDGQDVELGALDELRGRCFATHLTIHLRERFGRRFWRERRAGELVKELWNTGSSYTVEALAAELGLGDLDVAPWVDSAARGI